MNPRRSALALMALLVSSLVPLPEPAQAQGACQDDGRTPDGPLQVGVCYDWWDPSWHLRMPVLVEPKVLDRLSGRVLDVSAENLPNYPVAADLDFTDAVRSARFRGSGWPRDSQEVLSSFTFDTNSVRVVEVDRVRGCPLVRDRTAGNLRCIQGGDRLADAALPASFMPGLLDPPEGKDAFFDPQRNAVGTVQWQVTGLLDRPRLYFVYFDVLQNGAKPPPTYKPEASGLVGGLHFVRWGTDILGVAPSRSTFGGGVVVAQALYDNTTIRISKYVNKGVEPAVMVQATVHALVSDKGSNPDRSCTDLALPWTGSLCLPVSQDEHFFFRVQANRPVVAMLTNVNPGSEPHQATWYPSVDGGLAGTRFLFRAASGGGKDPQGLATPLYVVSPDAQTFVQVSAIDQGDSFGTFLQGAAEVRMQRGTRVTAGLRYMVQANTPVMVVQGGDGINHVSTSGAPVGAHMVGFVRNDLSVVNQGTTAASIVLASPINNADFANALRNRPVPPGINGTLQTRGCEGGCNFGSGDVWRLDARDDASLLWAKSGETGLIPVGGQDGRSFLVALRPEFGNPAPPNDPARSRLIVKALYNGTRVTVTNQTTGAELVNATLGLHDWLDTSSGRAQVPYGDYRVEASKPVAAWLLGVPRSGGGPPMATYYQAKVEPPLLRTAPADFHGHAVGWDSKLKTLALAPGERERVKLTLVNLGRAPDAGNLPDGVGIEKLPILAPPNVTLPQVDVSSVEESGLATLQKRDITVSIAVPEGTPTGTAFEIPVVASSRGNPNFTDVARIVVTVQIRYEFTLQFLETRGSSIQKIVKPDSATCTDVEVRNTGTGDVAVRLQMTPTAKSEAALGFEPRLLPLLDPSCAPGAPGPADKSPCTPGDTRDLVDAEGKASRPVVLRPGAACNLTLYVKAPAQTRPLPLDLEIQGTAEQDASVRQQLTASVFTNVEAKVRLTALNQTALVPPGGNATYRFLVENVGDVETPVEYATTGLLPPGWRVNFSATPPLLRPRGTSDAEGRPQDRGEFLVNVTAAPDAPVAMVVPVNVVATSNIIIEASDTARAFRQSDQAKVTAVVANNFTLDEPENLPLTINPGEAVALQFELRNVANGNFTLQALPGALPANWTLAIAEPAGAVLLERGDRVVVRLNVTPPKATKAGVYEVGVALVTKDPFTQAARFRNATLLVRSTADFRLVPDVAEAVMAPGGQRDLQVQAVNSGNLPISLRLAAAPPPGFTATLTDRVKADLEPGEEASFQVRVRAPDGAAASAAPLRLVGTDDRSNRQRELAVGVAAGSLDLVVREVVLPSRDLRPGQPAVAVATVLNQGTIPANQVAIALVVDGQGVRNDTLRTLPPGEPRTVTLPWTVQGQPREIAVVIDADGRYTESDEGNNQARVVVGRDLPGAPAAALALAACLAAAAAGLGRGRKKPPRRGAGPHG